MIDYDLLRTELNRHPYPLLFATISGAHLYGFASPDSDYDLRGVHVLPFRQVSIRTLFAIDNTLNANE